MENYNTFAKTEALLQTAIGLLGSSIKEIAAATNILLNTLYKWKTSNKAHLSPQKANRLLLYSTEIVFSSSYTVWRVPFTVQHLQHIPVCLPRSKERTIEAFNVYSALIRPPSRRFMATITEQKATHYNGHSTRKHYNTPHRMDTGI